MKWNACSPVSIDVKELFIRKTNQNFQHQLRPQKNLWSFDFMLTCLLILAVTFFFLILYSILQTNQGLFHIGNTKLFSLKILDTSSAASLFVTVVGALLVRHQFALGLLPRINYTSISTIKQTSTAENQYCDTWRVEIRNTGLGSAIINRAEYFIEGKDAKSDVRFNNFDNLLKELTKLDLVRERDYWLDNVTAGYSLLPKDDCLAFEIKKEHLEKLKCLNMMLYFQG